MTQQTMQFIRRKGAQMFPMIRIVVLSAAFAAASLVVQPASDAQQKSKFATRIFLEAV